MCIRDRGSIIPCANSSADPPNDCRRLVVEVFGLGVNRTYRVGIEASGSPIPEGEIPAGTLCPNVPANDIVTNGTGYANVELNCHYGFWGNSVRVTVDGFVSNWQVWDQF